MRCSRCGETAVVQRDGGYFCGRCALTRDWEEIVRLVQDLDVAETAHQPAAAAPTAAPGSEGAPLPPADPFS